MSLEQKRVLIIGSLKYTPNNVCLSCGIRVSVSLYAEVAAKEISLAVDVMCKNCFRRERPSYDELRYSNHSLTFINFDVQTTYTSSGVIV